MDDTTRTLTFSLAELKLISRLLLPQIAKSPEAMAPWCRIDQAVGELLSPGG